ncbi:MAG: tol-pal system-associated acyl-CoA thioesterase [Bdellovibrionales bacterium]
MFKPHIHPIRIYYEDTDAGGIVYHANYLKFAERARTELLRFLGYDHQRVKQEFNLILVVRHVEIEYYAPARLDDALEVRTQPTKIGNTSIGLKQSIYKDEKLLADIKVTVVAISPEGKALRLPPHLRQIFGSQTPAK